jgi:hypothetical protein
MKVYPLFGNGIAGHSFPVTRQRRLNCYLENRPDGDKARVVIFGTPGLKLKFTLAGVVRGILGTESNLYAVIGGTFYSLSSTGGTLYSSATIASVFGNVSMARDPDQIVIVDGSKGYIFNTTTQVLSKITSSGFPNGAKTVAFVGGYFVCEKPRTQYFYCSDTFDGSTWNALAFAAASQYSDNILAVDSLAGNLVVFSERHTEFWQNVGSSPQPFAPILSVTSEYGINAIYSRGHVGSTLLFLAQNPQGTSQVCQISGYTVAVVSTPDLEDIISQFSTVADATALTYVINGHPMYQLTFPTDNRSFLYDLSTGIWSETQSGVPTGYAQRHIGQLSTTYQNQALITDYISGRVYTIDENTFTDNGQTIVRELVTRHGSSDFNVITVAEFFLDMETGVGLQTGQGSQPQIMLDVSKDNGRTWSNPRLLSVGAVGKYMTRVIARRFGSARDFVFRIRMTDPVKFVVTEGAAVVQERRQ